MHVIFITIGMHTNLWMANSNIQLHIFKVTAHKELKLGLHILQSTYITMVEIEFYQSTIMLVFADWVTYVIILNVVNVQENMCTHTHTYYAHYKK